MNRCLCCGGAFSAKSTDQERNQGWHKRCIKKFFGTETLPELDLTEDTFRKLADRTVHRGLTVPGVQRKLSLHLTRERESRLTLVNYPTGYILKPQTPEYENLPEYEQLSMHMAELVGIRTVPHGLIRMGDNYAYITKRIDREISEKGLKLYAMEDFCQLSGRLTADKYRGSYENCGRIIRRYSEQEGFDLSELYLRILFSFLTGNSDMHLKNFSLIEESPASRSFRLSAAYDLLPVKVILPSDQEEMALTVNGKKKNLRKKDFLALGESIGLGEKAVEHILKHLLGKREQLLSACEEAYLTEKQIEGLKDLIRDRAELLQ